MKQLAILLAASLLIVRGVLAQPETTTTTAPAAVTSTAPVTASVAKTASPPVTSTLKDALTLEDSIRLALRNHGDVGASEQSFIASRERVTSARSGLLPQITGTANYDYQNRHASTSSNNGLGGTGFSTSNSGVTSSTTTNISIAQNIFDGGRTRAQVRSARAQELNAVGSFGGSRSGLAFQVAQAFYEQLRQEKLVAQRKGQVALAQQQLEQIQAQIEIGTAAKVDVQSVQVTLSQARFDLVSAQNALSIATVNFRNALGLGRGPTLQLLESSGIAATATPVTNNTSTLLSPAPVVPQLKPLEEYIGEAKNLRPDLLQARASVQQNEAAESLAKIEKRPQVTASATYNLDPRASDDRRFNFGAGVSIPIFDGGGRSADLRASQAELAASRIRLQQLDKDVAADVETSFVDISGQVERIANARELVEAARTNLETATEKYRLGLGIVLDIVNAQTQLFNAQTSATQAVYDYEIARANLDRAVGRFAWADPGQSTPVTAPTTIPIALKVTNR
jgi:outer membrane protein